MNSTAYVIVKWHGLSRWSLSYEPSKQVVEDLNIYNSAWVAGTLNASRFENRDSACSLARNLVREIPYEYQFYTAIDVWQVDTDGRLDCLVASFRADVIDTLAS